MARRAFIELCQCADDWYEMREVFVRSFTKYPLFEHVVQNKDNRAEFLKRYFAANFNVQAADGKFKLFTIRKLLGINDLKQRPSFLARKEDLRSTSQIIGGVFFAAPAENGVGWTQYPDEDYWKAYRHHGLPEVDAEAYERLKSYEEWESKHVSNYVFGLKIPLWNGLLCAIDPEYSGNGCGGEIYAACMEAIGQTQFVEHRKGASHSRINEVEPLLGDSNPYKKGMQATKRFSENRLESGRMDSLIVKILHSMSFFTHHRYLAFAMDTAAYKANPDMLKKFNFDENGNHLTEKEPGVLALSHCPRATQFHISNGFKHIKSIPYCPSDDQKPLFNVNVLISRKT